MNERGNRPVYPWLIVILIFLLLAFAGRDDGWSATRPPQPEPHPSACKGKPKKKCKAKIVGAWLPVVYELTIDGKPAGEIVGYCWYPPKGKPRNCSITLVWG